MRQAIPSLVEQSRQGEMRLFSNDEFELKIVPVGDSFIVAAPGLSRALGFRDASNLLAGIPADEKGSFLDSTPGGQQEVGCVTEPGLYRAIGQRQAARIKNEQARDMVTRFQRWVYHEVLPQIRKTGSYSIVQQFQIPGTLAEALEFAARQAREIEAKEALIEQQKQRIALDAPKVEVFDSWFDPHNAVEPTDFAKRIGLRSAQQLNKLMQECGIVRKDIHPRTGKPRNLPTADWGYAFKVTPTRIPTGGFVDVAWILPQGQLDIVEELRNNGLIDF